LDERPTVEELKEGIEEYGFSFWFKWDFLWDDDNLFNLETTRDLIEMAYLTSNIDSGYKH
jgi:hypothetical protein